MKAAFIVGLLLVSAVAFGQIPGQASGDKLAPVASLTTQEAVTGQLGPVIFTQTITLPKGGTAATSRWVQTGYSPNATLLHNTRVMRYNPEVFTVTLKKWLSVDDDSVGVGYGRFECAYDTTDDAAWNADTTNVFIDNAAYSHSLYGQWKFLPFKRVATDTTDFSYPVRIWRGGYTRFVLKGWNNTDNGSILDDSCTVILEFTGER